MKYIASCFMCFLLCSVQAQNLVPNGGFEDGDPCPTTLAAINELDHWYFGIQLPGLEWNFWPSPDWYHTCSPFEQLQPPNVLTGYQVPFSGGGMAGLFTYNHNFSNDREVISIELLEELEVGDNYTFVMSAVNAISNVYGGSSNRLGMKLTTYPYWTTLEGPITNSAHFSMDEVLGDTANWNTFTQEIIADSAYKYLHIGNFYNDSLTTAVILNDEVSFIPYYFIDEVSLIKNTLSTDVEQKKTSVLNAFPNPGTHQMNIISQKGIVTVQVFKINGQKVFEKSLDHDEKFELNISPWSSGVYILKATDGEGAIHRLKLIKN